MENRRQTGNKRLEKKKSSLTTLKSRVSSKSFDKALQEKYNKLKKQEESLDREISELVSKGVTPDLELQMQALHDYNEMKDLTQMVLGYLADVEETTVVELHERYGLPLQ